MNKLKFLLIFLLLFQYASAAEPQISSGNILSGDKVYYSVPFEYTDACAADICISYSENLEFTSVLADNSTITPTYTDMHTLHTGFLFDEVPPHIIFCFEAGTPGNAFISLNEITVISENLEQTVHTLNKTIEFPVQGEIPILPPSSGGGGGSGGGGSGGGGGGFSGGSVNAPPVLNVPVTPIVPPEKIENPLPFSDLKNHGWAEEYIKDLYSKNVISRDTQFRPDDFVTRAEFAKLALLAFGIEPGGICTFPDVAESDWFYPYVSAAQENGIILGDGSGFKPHERITREDICVILSRLLKSSAEEASAEFADADEISDYAVSAVNKLFSLSVISGMGDGNFAPKEYATRAQSAKMISISAEKAVK